MSVCPFVDSAIFLYLLLTRCLQVPLSVNTNFSPVLEHFLKFQRTAKLPFEKVHFRAVTPKRRLQTVQTPPGGGGTP